MNLRNRLTVLITVYERKKYLKRLLTYYGDLDCRQIIVDSGKKRLFLGDEFPGVEYYHYPGIDFFDALFRGAKKIDTEYVLQIADDDFVVIESIVHCDDFLGKNRKYAGATGHRAFFQEDSGGFFSSSYRGGFSEYMIEDYYHENALKRLYHFFNKNLTVAHHIIKMECLLDCLKIMHQNDRLYSLRYYEIMLLYVTLVCGNYKFLPILFLLRSNGVSCHKEETFSDDRLKLNVNYKNLLFDLFHSNDPLSASLANATQKNIVFCRMVTAFLFIVRFLGVSDFAKYVYGKKIAPAISFMLFILSKIVPSAMKEGLKGFLRHRRNKEPVRIKKRQSNPVFHQRRLSNAIDDIVDGPFAGDKVKYQNNLDQITQLIQNNVTDKFC